MKLCCIFNYAPLYRASIYKKIDSEFDTQFCFSDIKSDIAKMDYSEFKMKPYVFHEDHLFGKLLWRHGLLKLAKQPYDAFLITGDTTLSYLSFMLLCKLSKKRVYGWGHGAKGFGGKFGWLSKLLFKLCDGYFSYGEGGKDRLVSLGVPAEKIHVIYNSLNEGIEATDQIKLKSDILKVYFNNDFPTIVFVGRLTPVKQLDWLIKGMFVHKSHGINYNLLIIGDGKEKDNLIKLATENHIEENVWFYGECYDNNKLNALIYNSDLCVSPGNVGLTALHAMMYGTPVLSHDDFETQMPEYETIVPGKTGTLYKRGNFEDFCLKLESWLAENHNRDMVRNNCYAMINDKFNSNYQIALLKKVLLDV